MRCVYERTLSAQGQFKTDLFSYFWASYTCLAYHTYIPDSGCEIPSERQMLNQQRETSQLPGEYLVASQCLHIPGIYQTYRNPGHIPMPRIRPSFDHRNSPEVCQGEPGYFYATCYYLCRRCEARWLFRYRRSDTWRLSPGPSLVMCQVSGRRGGWEIHTWITRITEA